MSTYENPYFGLSIEFPEAWIFRYWGNAGGRSKISSIAQLAYDDVPLDQSCEKELFYACKKSKGSPAIFSSSAGMSAFYRESDFDFASERMSTENESKRESGAMEIAGIPAKYLYLELQFQNTQARRKFVYWEAKPKLWLNFAMQGDSHENYNESVRLLSYLNLQTCSALTRTATRAIFAPASPLQKMAGCSRR